MDKRVKAGKARAFTLVDLMVAVAIVGVLAMVAFPNYRAYTLRTRRAEAETILMQDAAFMERLYTVAGCYNPGQDANGNYTDCTKPIASIPCPPMPFCQSPSSGSSFYNVAFFVLNANDYTLRATPIAGKPQENDGIVQLTSTGAKWWDKNNDTVDDASEDTWLNR